jgi:hypothetical protein
MQTELKNYIDQMVDQKLSEMMLKVKNQMNEILSKHLLEKSAPQSLLTYAEISKEFKISLKTLKKLKKTGRLNPLCKGGRFYLFERNSVIQALQTRPRVKPEFLRK